MRSPVRVQIQRLMPKKVITAVIAPLMLSAFAAGCSQQPTEGAAETKPAESAKIVAAKEALPEKFAKPLKVAVVQQTGQGDYFQQYLNGTKLQASSLNMDLSIYDAQGDNAVQASQLDQAIASNVDGIIVRHGFADSLCPGVNRAIDQGIPVVVYDVDIQPCAPRAIQAQQSDQLMAELVLTEMAKSVPDGAEVGYVNVAGIAPLDRRDAVWKEFLTSHHWDEKFKTGKYTASTATDSASMVDNALKANQGVVGIYAPYDEFTKATLTALEQNPVLAGKVAVYGADISTADIELMTREGSAWKATGATDPNAIGAAVVRTLALQMVGELKETKVEFPPILVTQEFLRSNNIRNMSDLRKNAPELNISDVVSADWMPKIEF